MITEKPVCDLDFVVCTIHYIIHPVYENLEPNLKTEKASIILVTIMAVLVVMSSLNQFSLPRDNEVLEINDYQGERLSSISDFRENSIKGPQDVNLTNYRLKINGLVSTPIEYKYDEVLENFPAQEKVVRLNCVEGWSAKVLWEGVSIMELVEEANPSSDAKVIIFHAEDGYTTSLPIEYIRDRDLILAYKINRVTLPKENGFPFQLVAESKWGYKWCKWVVELEFSDDADYEGFWESRGYSNDADLDKSFWER
jgi:DMSO/TMAO reductase YedYZ molybdopterin-dependent catalytic subunit